LKELGKELEKWIYKPDIDLAQQHILIKLWFSTANNLIEKLYKKSRKSIMTC